MGRLSEAAEMVALCPGFHPLQSASPDRQINLSNSARRTPTTHDFFRIGQQTFFVSQSLLCARHLGNRELARDYRRPRSSDFVVCKSAIDWSAIEIRHGLMFEACQLGRRCRSMLPFG